VADQLTIGIRFAFYTDLMLLFGLPLFGLYGLKGGNILPFGKVVGWLAVAATGLSLLSIVAMTASMAGVPLGKVDPGLVWVMISETPMGNAWVVRMVALALIVLGGRKSAAMAATAAAVALASLAWTGHGAAGEGSPGTVQLAADIGHLLAAGAWLGALVALVVLLFRPVAEMSSNHLNLTHRALDGFSVAGTFIVALIVVTGAVNSWMLVGPAHFLSLATTPYGQLLLSKLALFGVMLCLAAANRFRLTPALNRVIQSGDVIRAVRQLRVTLFTESSAALIILGLVAWLGTLEPPIVS
jgi:putative copper resistance protein D